MNFIPDLVVAISQLNNYGNLTLIDFFLSFNHIILFLFYSILLNIVNFRILYIYFYPYDTGWALNKILFLVNKVLF